MKSVESQLLVFASHTLGLIRRPSFCPARHRLQSKRHPHTWSKQSCLLSLSMTPALASFLAV